MNCGLREQSLFQGVIAAALFFGLNLAGSLAIVFFHLPAAAGPSCLASAIVAGLVSFVFLDRGARRLDRLVLARCSTKER